MGAVIRGVAARRRALVLIEDDAEDLRAVQGGEGLVQQPPWCPVGGDNEEEAVHPSRDDSAILDGGEGRRVDDDEVVAPPRLVDQLSKTRGFQNLVWTGRCLPSADHGEVERGPRANNRLKSDAWIEDRVDEVAARRTSRDQKASKCGAPQIGIYQKHSSIRSLGQGPGQINRRHGLAVADAGARDRDDLEVSCRVEL